MKHFHAFIIFLLCTAAVLLTACALTDLFPIDLPSALETDQPLQNQPTSEPVAPATEMPAIDPTSVCLPASGDYLSFVEVERGYCLLYPSTWTTSPGYARGEDGVTFTAPPPQNPVGMEYVLASLTVEFNGPADGYDATSYSQQWFAYFQPGNVPAQAYTTLSGVEVLEADELASGMLPVRGYFVVVNGYRYLLTLTQPGYLSAEEDTSLTQMLTTVRFFPPQGTFSITRPEEVCPQQGAGNFAYTHMTEGWCVLMPEEMQPDPTFTGNFEGGPVLENHPSFGEVKTQLTIGSYGYFPGQTPREAIAAWLTSVPISEPVDLSVGGYPALTFNDYREPWDDNITFVSVDGHIFTILVQPYEPDQWPDGIPFFNAARSLALSTLTFFTPWH